jgi:histone H3/H4
MDYNASLHSNIFKALSDYCKDNACLDLVETKFGIEVLEIEKNRKTGRKYVFRADILENSEQIERYFYEEMRNHVIDQFCMAQPDDDIEHMPTKDTIYQGMIYLVQKYMPFVTDVEAYIDEMEEKLLIEYFARALQKGVSKEKALEQAAEDFGTILEYAVNIAVKAAEHVYHK